MSNVALKEKNDNNITIALSGRIDSNSAPQVQQDIMDLLADKPQSVTLDAENLEYISSAGLRVILKTKKTVSDTKIINASVDVYEIFEMTGFTEMMDISKALRHVSIEGCREIGRGGFGTVYRINGDTIVKVYDRTGTGMDFIRREQETSRRAFVYGLPTAISFDVVRVGEYYGVVYEMLDASTLGGYVTENPDKLEEYIEKMAELAKQIHSTKVKEGDFQDGKTIFRASIENAKDYMSPGLYEHFGILVDALPEGDTMLHGDFHPKNIMVCGGELELIDMGDVSRGCPLIELTSLYILHKRIAADPERMSGFMGMTPENAPKVWPLFLKYYFGDRLTPEIMPVFEKAMGILAMLRTGATALARIACAQEELTPGQIAYRDMTIKGIESLQPEQMKADIEAALDALYR